MLKNTFLPIIPLLSLLLMALTAQQSSAQTADSLQFTRSLPVSPRFATVDNLSNIYLVSAENIIEKYDSTGRFLTRYSNNRLGRPTLLDVTNPLKLLVWYADFRTVILLDRSLTVLGELDLIRAGFPDVRLVAAAPDGNLWGYDEVNFRLLKLASDGTKLAESQALNLLEFTPRQTACIRVTDSYVFVADPEAGIGIFDVFGQFNRVFKPLHPVRDFVVWQNQLCYTADTAIVIESVQGWNLKPRTIALPAGAGLVWLAGGWVLVQDEAVLRVGRY